MTEPFRQRVYRHGSRHAEIRDHLPIIALTPGNHAVKQAEHHRQKLTQRMALGVEDQKRRSDEGRGQGDGIAFHEDPRGENDGGGQGPEELFSPGEGREAEEGA